MKRGASSRDALDNASQPSWSIRLRCVINLTLSVLTPHTPPLLFTSSLCRDAVARLTHFEHGESDWIQRIIDRDAMDVLVEKRERLDAVRLTD